MRQVVLDLPQFFFADDDTLKSFTSFFLLREFGEAYSEAVFSEVRHAPAAAMHTFNIRRVHGLCRRLDA
jgi:hypothetical protein